MFETLQIESATLAAVNRTGESVVLNLTQRFLLLRSFFFVKFNKVCFLYRSTTDYVTKSQL
jgi:hypothetical protein